MTKAELALVSVVPVAIAVGQILFKISSRSLQGDTVSALLSLLLNPAFVSAIILYAAATVFWVFLLQRLPLSAAYPFMALTFVLVPLFGWAILGEKISGGYIVGAIAILLGLFLIVRSSG